MTSLPLLSRLRAAALLLALAALIAAVTLTAPAAAQALLELDPGQTQVEFTLPATLHTVHGTFKLKRGTVRFDPATGAAAGEIVVDALSGATGNASRDRRMHRDILESVAHPEIVFTPTSVTGQVAPEGESHVEVQGTLMLHGAPHSVTLATAVQLTGGRLTAAAEFPVPYVKWGLKNPSTFLLRVSDTITVAVHAAGRLTFAAHP